MPVLPNARHESFAQALAKGKTADEAYVEAGYKANRGNATRLKANECIRKRAAEIVNRVSEKAEWTAAARLKMLADIAERTSETEPRSAIAAIGEANKMQGSYPPSRVRLAGPNGGPIPFVDLTRLSGDQLDQLESIFGPLAGPADDDAPDPGGEGETRG